MGEYNVEGSHHLDRVHDEKSVKFEFIWDLLVILETDTNNCLALVVDRNEQNILNKICTRIVLSSTFFTEVSSKGLDFTQKKGYAAWMA